MLEANGLAPDSIDELRSAIQPFLSVYDELWRLERLYGYYDWLNTGQATHGLLRSVWLDRTPNPPEDPDHTVTESDVRAEMGFWNDASRRQLTADEVKLKWLARLTREFGADLTAVLARASNPTLASRGLPVWNSAVMCLVPSRLGQWTLAGAQDNDASNPGLGMTYAYRDPTRSTKLTLYLYDMGTDGVLPGITDPRCEYQAREALHNLVDVARLTECSIEPISGIVTDQLHSRSGASCTFLSATWRERTPQGITCTGALSVTGFRSAFLKVRLTAPDELAESDAGQALIETLNLDLADFVVRYGP